MQVDFPEPDYPIKAVVSPASHVTSKLSKICTSARVGYLKLTPLNSILPCKPAPFSEILIFPL